MRACFSCDPSADPIREPHPRASRKIAELISWLRFTLAQNLIGILSLRFAPEPGTLLLLASEAAPLPFWPGGAAAGEMFTVSCPGVSPRCSLYSEETAWSKETS